MTYEERKLYLVKVNDIAIDYFKNNLPDIFKEEDINGMIEGYSSFYDRILNP